MRKVSVFATVIGERLQLTARKNVPQYLSTDFSRLYRERKLSNGRAD
ncbi:MAG: hypothetical protein U0136_08480 [Bdellovibrionota bacterium]